MVRVGVREVGIDVRAIVLELVEQERTLASKDPHPRPGCGRDGGRTEVRHHTRRMPTRQERIILRDRGACRNLGVNGVYRPEQVDS